MQFIQGLLIIILVPFIDYETYSTVKHFDDNSIVLEVKTNKDLPINKEVLCIAVNGDSMFEFYTQINARNENLLFIKRPQLDQLNLIEKRNFNRINCNIGFVASPVSISSKTIYNSDKKFTGLILNISGGGVLTETSLNLPVGMVFNFKLKLNAFVGCKVMVNRTISSPESNIFHSGCQFIDMDIESVKEISLYTFKEQLKQKRKDLNNIKMSQGGKSKNDE
ncbi:MAG: PilZ domain-containing protein [Lutisporaceae bacterium]